MNDLKLCIERREIDKKLKLLKGYSDNIQMEFGLDKCAKCTFAQGKPTKTEDIKIDHDATIQELDNEASYKCLGVEDGDQICHKQICKTITKNYLHRTKLILKTYLSPRNKIKAIHQLAIPV